jgi:hypothetical protein
MALCNTCTYARLQAALLCTFLGYLQYLHSASSVSAVLTSCSLQQYANAAIAHTRMYVHVLPLTTAA